MEVWYLILSFITRTIVVVWSGGVDSWVLELRGNANVSDLR